MTARLALTDAPCNVFVRSTYLSGRLSTPNFSCGVREIMKSPLRVILAVSLLLSACAQAPPAFSELMKDDPIANPQPDSTLTNTTNDLVVYLDTSRSMAGYLTQDNLTPSVFSRTLQELRNVSTMLSPPLNVRVRRISSAVSDPLNDTFLSEAAITQRIFNGSETNLTAAIDTFDLPVELEASESAGSSLNQKIADQDPTVAQAAKPPARFHILVTDGVQSSRQSKDATCAAASDQICVRKKILGLLKNRWSAYVIGLRSEFKGNLYSEISRSAIPYATTDTESYRPFYLYLFSPDSEALDRLVSILSRRLRPLLPSDDGLRLVALTSKYSEGFGSAELQIEPENSIVSVAPTEIDPFRATLKVSLEDEKGTPKQFSILARVNWTETIKDSGTPRELASIVKWDLVSVYPAKADAGALRLPQLKLIATEPQSNGDMRLRLTASWPKANGRPSWRGYRLEGRLSLAQQTPAWVKQWSTDTDTTFDTGNRTLYLESALLGLWHNEEIENQVVSEMYLRVGAK